jgi:hypothetical protein
MSCQALEKKYGVDKSVEKNLILELAEFFNKRNSRVYDNTYVLTRIICAAKYIFGKECDVKIPEGTVFVRTCKSGEARPGACHPKTFFKSRTTFCNLSTLSNLNIQNATSIATNKNDHVIFLRNKKSLTFFDFNKVSQLVGTQTKMGEKPGTNLWEGRGFFGACCVIRDMEYVCSYFGYDGVIQCDIADAYYLYGLEDQIRDLVKKKDTVEKELVALKKKEGSSSPRYYYLQQELDKLNVQLDALEASDNPNEDLLPESMKKNSKARQYANNLVIKAIQTQQAYPIYAINPRPEKNAGEVIGAMFPEFNIHLGKGKNMAHIFDLIAAVIDDKNESDISLVEIGFGDTLPSPYLVHFKNPDLQFLTDFTVDSDIMNLSIIQTPTQINRNVKASWDLQLLCKNMYESYFDLNFGKYDLSGTGQWIGKKREDDVIYYVHDSILSRGCQLFDDKYVALPYLSIDNEIEALKLFVELMTTTTEISLPRCEEWFAINDGERQKFSGGMKKSKKKSKNKYKKKYKKKKSKKKYKKKKSDKKSKRNL